ncbi:alpha/beta fold hydrolase [Streptomyces pseudovenezuelae]|uniref:Pimeloyl-ACP methyl ester carboxylesterase n=1 Tax=Streptomyces pseudovenezuelae TaxID=67350 RepID=A0ABT6LYX8_9ACTN|nr:alpha/beta hydrolase [Streptomyces pseudovenezuelae]MDH6221507.1 pimeloyl-ACP methyl ester carboxylesterase [Streptomyces pseudovenezuelae]
MSFVLIHGAGFGADCWDELIPYLAAETLAVDLPGRGTRAGVPLGTVTLADCADAVREDVEAKDLRDVVLIGHSFAGVTVPRVLELIPERIRQVVLVSAVVPPDGSRVLDEIDPGVRHLVEQSISGGIYHQTREGAAAMLCNDMDEATAASALDRLAEESAAVLTEPVDLSGYRREIPRTYVHLTRDQCYVEELQQRSIALLRPEVIDLDTGHMAMISAPEKLAAVLNAVHG